MAKPKLSLSDLKALVAELESAKSESKPKPKERKGEFYRFDSKGERSSASPASFKAAIATADSTIYFRGAHARNGVSAQTVAELLSLIDSAAR